MIKSETDNDEEKAAKEFIQQHSESCKVYNRPLFTYCFTQTGIGVEVSILCTKCGSKNN